MYKERTKYFIVIILIFLGKIYAGDCMDDGFQEWSKFAGVAACNYNPEAMVGCSDDVYVDGIPDDCCIYPLCDGQCPTGEPSDAYLDDCGVCNGENEDMDCNDDCFGNAYTDACGTCIGDDDDCMELQLLEIGNPLPSGTTGYQLPVKGKNLPDLESIQIIFSVVGGPCEWISGPQANCEDITDSLNAGSITAEEAEIECTNQGSACYWIPPPLSITEIVLPLSLESYQSTLVIETAWIYLAPDPGTFGGEYFQIGSEEETLFYIQVDVATNIEEDITTTIEIEGLNINGHELDINNWLSYEIVITPTPGCTDEDACNFNCIAGSQPSNYGDGCGEGVTIDDGSCVYEVDCDGTCVDFSNEVDCYWQIKAENGEDPECCAEDQNGTNDCHDDPNAAYEDYCGGCVEGTTGEFNCLKAKFDVYNEEGDLITYLIDDSSRLMLPDIFYSSIHIDNLPAVIEGIEFTITYNNNIVLDAFSFNYESINDLIPVSGTFENTAPSDSSLLVDNDQDRKFTGVYYPTDADNIDSFSGGSSDLVLMKFTVTNSLTINENIISYVNLQVNEHAMGNENFDQLDLTLLDITHSADYFPKSFELGQNYPNPFNPTTYIPYEVQYVDFLSIKIYDIHGRLVKLLVGSIHNPGHYEILWDGTNNSGDAVSAGIYLYSLETSTVNLVKQLVLLK